MQEQSETTRVDAPRIMIAAPHGRSGKTVLALGLLRALSRGGVAVRPFKKGPDFIDPGWHRLAAGRVSRNLDCYFMTADQIRETLAAPADEPADLCLIEGAMGLFDGLDVEGSSSSAQIAKLSATPVVLVVDVTRMTRSAAAVVMGCCAFDKDLAIAGVILNKVRGARQRALVTEAIERYCGVPVIGAVTSEACMELPDRHLGLVSSTEAQDARRVLDEIADRVEAQVDLSALRSIARLAPPLALKRRLACPFGCAGEGPAARRATIAVVRDAAFSFYYPENLAALEQAGAEVVYADSLLDTELPTGIDGLYIGGGFPEMFADKLQGNAGFRASVRAQVDRGLPVFAECGGLMYLGRSLVCGQASYRMVGAMAYDTVMRDKQQGHGYARALVEGARSWLKPGTRLVGHEHHHSQVVGLDSRIGFSCRNERGRGVAEGRDGLCYKGVVAGYLHVNAIASPDWAPSFVGAAERFRTPGPSAAAAATETKKPARAESRAVCAAR